MSSDSHHMDVVADLRSMAQEYHRDSDYKHKWSRGALSRRGRTSVDHQKPAPRTQKKSIDDVKRRQAEGTKSARQLNMNHVRDTSPGTDESESPVFAEEDVEPRAVEADVGVMYNYDNEHGPSSGSQILNVALEKAIERHRDAETNTLLRTEYELVNIDGESMSLTRDKQSRTRFRAHDKDLGHIDHEDDDFEFV